MSFWRFWTRYKPVFQLFASLPECDLPRVPYRHVLIGLMETNQSNNIWGEKVFLHSTVGFCLLDVCVCVCVCTVGNFRLCDCICCESLCVCIYICTEFYFASLIQNNIVYCFYSVWSRCTKKYVFLKVVTSGRITALVDDNAGTNLSS